MEINSGVSTGDGGTGLRAGYPRHMATGPSQVTPPADETPEQRRLREHDEAEERRHLAHEAAEQQRRLEREKEEQRRRRERDADQRSD